MSQAHTSTSLASPTIVPGSEELLAELWEARIVHPYASAERIRQYILERCRNWEISLKRVKKIIKDYPYLHTIPLAVSEGITDEGRGNSVSMAASRTMRKEALQLLLLEFTIRENVFLNHVHEEAAQMWHPTRCEFVMMAAGLKPCCMIWNGVSDDGDNPQYSADFAKICLWMTTVWIVTFNTLKNLPHIDPALGEWLYSVEPYTIEHSITTGWLDHGRFKIPYPGSYFSGRLVYSSKDAAPGHKLMVERVFHKPEEYPPPLLHSKSPFKTQKGQFVLSESALAASLGYPVALPSTRGLNAYTATAYISEDFADGRSYVTSFMFAAPFDVEKVILWYRSFEAVMQDILLGQMNLTIIPCPDGKQLQSVELNRLQRVSFGLNSRDWDIYPREPLGLTMEEAYEDLRESLAPKFGLNPFVLTKKSRNFMFSPWSAIEDECDLRCDSSGRWQVSSASEREKPRGRPKRNSRYADPR